MSGCKSAELYEHSCHKQCFEKVHPSDVKKKKGQMSKGKCHPDP